jgi:hypothetical protein
VIRREHLASTATVGGNPRTTPSHLAAERVKRGEAVRITGLGTLALAKSEKSTRYVYRLTLTAAVAKALGGAIDFASDSPDRPLLVDVRHLARALGADVEVWAPSVSHGSKMPGALLTKVSP